MAKIAITVVNISESTSSYEQLVIVYGPPSDTSEDEDEFAEGEKESTYSTSTSESQAWSANANDPA